MELKWHVPEYQEFLIPRMGGLHTVMNFIKVIGQHIDSSGIVEVWFESGVLGPKVAHHVLQGGDYNKAMRIHKLTFQEMWRTLLSYLLCHIQKQDKDL